jgi:prepilin signal peptidase PulO-like enzyme (type II secretory pathway)
MVPSAVYLAAIAACLVGFGPAGAFVGVAAIASAHLAMWGCRRPHGAAAVTAATVVVIAAAASRADPVALTAAVGLGAAAAVDLVERRIPTPIAHGTTLAVGILVATTSMAHGWEAVATVGLSMAAVVATYAGLWLAGGVGFGDVRLASATVSAATAGLQYVVAMVVVPLVVVPVVAVGWRLSGRHPPSPFGPALVAGWLVATAGLGS